MEAALSQVHGEQGLDFSRPSPHMSSQLVTFAEGKAYMSGGPDIILASGAQVLSQALPLTCYVTVSVTSPWASEPPL